MIIGIGIDLVEIERIKRAFQKKAFFVRAYTANEQEQIQNNYERAAGYFAAKEAVVKMLGTGFRQLSLQDIEICYTLAGAPIVRMNEKITKICKEHLIDTIHLSISHTKHTAVAVAIGEKLS